MGVYLHQYPVRGKSHIQHNSNREVVLLQHLQKGWAKLVEMTESERDK